jgi:preprotein translocase SecE subunit
MLDWKIYKEGQGKWARNSLAALIALIALVAAIRIYDSLIDPSSELEIVNTWWEYLKVSTWVIDYRFLVVVPVLIAFLIFDVWQYNHPAWADFLIETENEMKNRVTWPSKREEINSSAVVIIAVLLIGGYIFIVDWVVWVLYYTVYFLGRDQ